ncbi:hypothetical protein AgCh_008618 [Apium graveolens]
MAAMKKPEDVVTVDVHVAKDLLASGSSYLDVRTSEDYNNGHVDNAVNVPYMFMTQEGRVKNPDFVAQVSAVLKKEERLVVGCNIGGRAMKACVDLLNDARWLITFSILASGEGLPSTSSSTLLAASSANKNATTRIVTGGHLTLQRLFPNDLHHHTNSSDVHALEVNQPARL